MRKPRFIAGFDSAPVMMLATASYLRGQPFRALGDLPVATWPVTATRRLPRRLREWVFTASGVAEAVSSRRVARIDAEEVSRWVSEAYPARRYPAVAIGSSCGALVHLCAALGMPWLPQTFLVPVRQRIHPDDVDTAVANGVRPGRRLLRTNPDLQLHHVHDPNHDRLMVRWMAYFRLKRRRLGEAYERFLTERLEPGGTILIAECHRSWRTTTIGPRHVFQHGAPSGATEEEFHRGGPRVAEYLARYDSPVRRWRGPEPDTVSPEAEWGFAPALREDIVRFARAHGYQVQRVVFEEPEALSPLVADLYRWWYRRRQIPANRLFIESFLIIEPYWALRTGSVPFWMRSHTQESLAAVGRFLDEREPFDDIMLTLFQSGVEPVGLPRIADWERVLARARRAGWFAGLRPQEHPLDLGHIVHYDDALREIPARYPLPGPLTLAELDDFLAGAGGYEGVRWERVADPVTGRATLPT